MLVNWTWLRVHCDKDYNSLNAVCKKKIVAALIWNTGERIIIKWQAERNVIDFLSLFSLIVSLLNWSAFCYCMSISYVILYNCTLPSVKLIHLYHYYVYLRIGLYYL